MKYNLREARAHQIKLEQNIEKMERAGHNTAWIRREWWELETEITYAIHREKAAV